MLFQFPIATYTMPNMTRTGEMTSELQLIGKDSRYQSDSRDITEICYIGQDLVKLKGGWVLSIMAALVGVVALASIFLFKNRILQMRVVACGGLLNMIYICRKYVDARHHHPHRYAGIALSGTACHQERRNESARSRQT